jgi:hypothetical protein
MKGRFIRTAPLFFVVFSCLIEADIFAASLDPALSKARQEAVAAGYTFLTSHDEIVAAAKKEGKLRVLGSFEAATYKAVINAFRKHYPFIDVQVVEMTGTADPQRFFLELKAGGAKDWDVFNISPDFWSAGIPYTKKFDLLGMATHKVLAIPPAMIDPKHRTIVSMGSSIHAIGYNRKLISDDKVPNGWEEFLRPDLKGKKHSRRHPPPGVCRFNCGPGREVSAGLRRENRRARTRLGSWPDRPPYVDCGWRAHQVRLQSALHSANRSRPLAHQEPSDARLRSGAPPNAE